MMEICLKASPFIWQSQVLNFFFLCGGFPPLLSQPNVRRDCASQPALFFPLLDNRLVGEGAEMLASKFHQNRLKSKPAGENPRIGLRRQHCSFSFSRWNQASALVWTVPETLATKFHPNRLKTKPTRENPRIQLAPYDGNTAFVLLKVKSSISLGWGCSRDTTHQISSKSVEN